MIDDIIDLNWIRYLGLYIVTDYHNVAMSIKKLPNLNTISLIIRRSDSLEELFGEIFENIYSIKMTYYFYYSFGSYDNPIENQFIEQLYSTFPNLQRLEFILQNT